MPSSRIGSAVPAVASREEPEALRARLRLTGGERNVMMPRKSVALVGAVALAVVALANPAQSVGPTPVTVRVGEGYYPQADTTAPYTYLSPPCPVSVGGIPTGMAALRSADAQGCISSFTIEGDDESGHYLTCIDDRCEALGFYWAIYQNGELTCVGLDDIRLKPKDELAFSYESYPTALALVGC